MSTLNLKGGMNIRYIEFNKNKNICPMFFSFEIDQEPSILNNLVKGFFFYLSFFIYLSLFIFLYLSFFIYLSLLSFYYNDHFQFFTWKKILIQRVITIILRITSIIRFIILTRTNWKNISFILNLFT
jgi:hypothetical protein